MQIKWGHSAAFINLIMATLNVDNYGEYCEMTRRVMSVCISGGFIPAAYVSPSYIITSEPEHTGHSGARSRTQGFSVKDVCHKELHASAIKHQAPARTNIQLPLVYWKLNALTVKIYFSFIPMFHLISIDSISTSITDSIKHFLQIIVLHRWLSSISNYDL